MTVRSILEIHNMGWNAFFEGKERDANPYLDASEPGKLWLRGFSDAENSDTTSKDQE